MRTLDTFDFASPILVNLLICFALTQTDYLFLLPWAFYKRAFSKDSFTPRAHGERPNALLVIPSLLRDAGDLDAITTTINSAATNGYPSDLYIVASVDGLTEFPKLYADLQKWCKAQSFPAHVRVYVTGTQTRLGKMMAVEAGVTFMKKLVEAGKAAVFPTIYFSVDGDGTLGAHALERLVNRLTTRHPLTGNMRRVVAGKICIRPDLIWRGWKKFFSMDGQLYMHAAREFVVSNVSRYNWKLTPRIGIPGALYVTWTDLLVQAPHYMGFMQTLTFKQWAKWMVGGGAPLFSESNAPPLPEALTGASDDTCMAFLASLAHWENDKLNFDAPPTPLHSLWNFVRSYFVERSHDYEPEARVYTYSPPTLKGLWKQRVRWNSSRVECAGRFWRSFWFHWEIGLPVSAHMILLLNTVFDIGFYYIALPYMCIVHGNSALMAFLIGYVAQTVAYTLYTVMSLALEKQYRSCWRVLFCLPMASAYCIIINCMGCVYGVSRDIFFFGNATNFAPEWTLMKGRCERIAIAFRIRRLLALSVRALVYGDVPLGTFWFGWTETKWTPSGFEGWTTGKKPRHIIPRPDWKALTNKFRAPSLTTDSTASLATVMDLTARPTPPKARRTRRSAPPEASSSTYLQLIALIRRARSTPPQERALPLFKAFGFRRSAVGPRERRPGAVPAVRVASNARLQP